MAIAVWGNRGPTIVRVAEAPSPVHVAMRHGTVMSLRGTASGWLFAAYRPREALQVVLAQEAAAGITGAALDDTAFEARLAEVRRQGMARVVDQAIPGVSALAAPVFDGQSRLLLSITGIGPSATFDTAWDGALASAIKRCAALLSRQLGAAA
jgi:DNA-binding IclR family transcriptional regulator